MHERLLQQMAANGQLVDGQLVVDGGPPLQPPRYRAQPPAGRAEQLRPDAAEEWAYPISREYESSSIYDDHVAAARFETARFETARSDTAQTDTAQRRSRATVQLPSCAVAGELPVQRQPGGRGGRLLRHATPDALLAQPQPAVASLRDATEALPVALGRRGAARRHVDGLLVHGRWRNSHETVTRWAPRAWQVA